MELYKLQVEEGRIFLHEHPANATSWQMEEVVHVAGLNGVQVVVVDQCMYGLRVRSSKGHTMPARKATKFMTNSWHLAEELKKRCDGTHEHQALVNDRARDAQVYPQELCKAICRGLIKQKTDDGKRK